MLGAGQSLPSGQCQRLQSTAGLQACCRAPCCPTVLQPKASVTGSRSLAGWVVAGTVEVTAELAQELLEASDQYMLDPLKRLCEMKISDELQPDNVSAVSPQGTARPGTARGDAHAGPPGTVAARWAGKQQVEPARLPRFHAILPPCMAGLCGRCLTPCPPLLALL